MRIREPRGPEPYLSHGARQRTPAHAAAWLVGQGGRCQARAQPARNGVVVERDDRDVVWDAWACLGKCLVRAEDQPVVHADDPRVRVRRRNSVRIASYPSSGSPCSARPSPTRSTPTPTAWSSRPRSGTHVLPRACSCRPAVPPTSGVRHIGLSEVTVDQLKEARNITEIASVQNLCNLRDPPVAGRPGLRHRPGHRVHPVVPHSHGQARPAGQPGRRVPRPRIAYIRGRGSVARNCRTAPPHDRRWSGANEAVSKKAAR